MEEIILKGIAAAPGIIFGRAFILDKQDFKVEPRSIMENEVPSEVARLEEALINAKNEILDLKTKLENKNCGNELKIFDAHLMILEDVSLISSVRTRIKQDKLSAEYIFMEVIREHLAKFLNFKDEYLKERATDINDIGRRVLKNLMGEHKLHAFENVTEKLVIISHDLSPSDTASLYNKNIIGFGTDVGGKTSHTAIMAKSLGVPAVVGLKDATLRVNNQDFLIVDGEKGLLVINPTEETLASYKSQQSKIQKKLDRYLGVKNLSCETKDGKKITLLANLEIEEELPAIIDSSAEGIGLYRTEFLYMNRVNLPDEEEQFKVYKNVLDKIGNGIVTIRTLDIGGDKFFSSSHILASMKHSVEWRGIQFSLNEPEIFKTQLRAILRASKFGNLRMMYPMITGLKELRKANALLEEAKEELKAKGIEFNNEMPVGMMVEVPSAVMMADLLAKETDFFSIGTNDLIQYSLAIDRTSERMAELYEPSNPAILRSIKMVVDAAHKEGIKVGLCGEMSGEFCLAFILLGLELDDLSMSSVSILQIKNMIRSVTYKEAKKVAHEAVSLATGEEVESIVINRLKSLIPGMFNTDN